MRTEFFGGTMSKSKAWLAFMILVSVISSGYFFDIKAPGLSFAFAVMAVIGFLIMLAWMGNDLDKTLDFDALN
jgi:hypothetical protein